MRRICGSIASVRGTSSRRWAAWPSRVRPMCVVRSGRGIRRVPTVRSGCAVRSVGRVRRVTSVGPRSGVSGLRAGRTVRVLRSWLGRGRRRWRTLLVLVIRSLGQHHRRSNQQNRKDRPARSDIFTSADQIHRGLLNPVFYSRVVVHTYSLPGEKVFLLLPLFDKTVTSIAEHDRGLLIRSFRSALALPLASLSIPQAGLIAFKPVQKPGIMRSKGEPRETRSGDQRGPRTIGDSAVWWVRCWPQKISEVDESGNHLLGLVVRPQKRGISPNLAEQGVDGDTGHS
jgi:hypothetical protein